MEQAGTTDRPCAGREKRRVASFLNVTPGAARRRGRRFLPLLAAPVLALCLASLAPRARAAVTQNDFLVRNTGELVALCSASRSDPLYTAAVNFCQGFAVGVFRVLQVENAADPAHRLFCLPSPAPSRDRSIAAFVRWAEGSSARAGLAAHDGIAMFLERRFPCHQGQ